MLGVLDTSSCPSVYSQEAKRVRANNAIVVGPNGMGPTLKIFDQAHTIYGTKSTAMPLATDHLCRYMRHVPGSA